MPAPAFATLTVAELQARREQLTIIDVRSPGEFASGHIPGSRNIPLDHLKRALPALQTAAEHGELAFICASGVRSHSACQQVADAGIRAATLAGGTAAWVKAGHLLEQVEGDRPVWAMDRQVRLAAGSLVLAGLAAGVALPGARWLSAAVAGGLMYSAVSNSCAMAGVLRKLPYNRRSAEGYDLDAELAVLRK